MGVARNVRYARYAGYARRVLACIEFVIGMLVCWYVGRLTPMFWLLYLVHGRELDTCSTGWLTYPAQANCAEMICA